MICAISVNGQNLKQINNVVEYTNETVHGMFIIHRLLELNNQDINKYVDLEGYKLNAFGNSDLPKDIFEDPKLEFYRRVAPNTIYKSIQLPANSEFSKTVKRINGICSQINGLRFSVADYISSNDLNSPDKLGAVYEMLQKCEQLYENYYGERAYISSLRADYVNAVSGGAKQKELFNIYSRLYEPLNIILYDMKKNKDYDLEGHIRNFESAISELEIYVRSKTNKRLVKSNTNVIKKAKDILSLIRSYVSSSSIPVEHTLYGKFYYYHNYKILHKANYSGIGMLYEMNEFLRASNSPYPMFLEIPHYYKVIYPERKEKVSILSEAPQIKTNTETVIPEAVVMEIPKVYEEREVIASDYTVYTNKTELEVELYDHLLLDGDIVSLSFNGEWVLRNHSLEAEPKKLKLTLNPNGKNYLLLHAENLGRRPPNTIGLSYLAPEGGRKKILLRSDLEKSELIEIIVQ